MTTSSDFPFSDTAIPPGETLAEELEVRDIPPDEMATLLGLSAETMMSIFKGEQPITSEIAAGLEAALWIPAQFWLNLEFQYRGTLAYLTAKQAKSAHGDR